MAGCGTNSHRFPAHTPFAVHTAALTGNKSYTRPLATTFYHYPLPRYASVLCFDLGCRPHASCCTSPCAQRLMEAGKRAGKAERELKVVPPAWPVERIEVRDCLVLSPMSIVRVHDGFPHIADCVALPRMCPSAC